MMDSVLILVFSLSPSGSLYKAEKLLKSGTIIVTNLPNRHPDNTFCTTEVECMLQGLNHILHIADTCTNLPMYP